MAHAVRPALIVMDLTMPNMDASEATRRLKADPRTKPILVLVVSGHVLDTVAQRVREAGADAFLAALGPLSGRDARSPISFLSPPFRQRKSRLEL